MFKERDVINIDEIDEEECGICKTHETAYDFFRNKAKENYEKAGTLFLNNNQIFSDEEMYEKAVYCSKCNNPLTKGSLSYEKSSSIVG